MERPLRGCIMCNSLYVKANGEVPCWEDVGEDLIFRTLQTEALGQRKERNIFHSPDFLRIRRSFMEGRYPYPALRIGISNRVVVYPVSHKAFWTKPLSR